MDASSEPRRTSAGAVKVKTAKRACSPLSRDIEQQIRVVECWSQAFASHCFLDGGAGKAEQHWHLPVSQRLVDPPTTSRTVQTRCAQALVDAATHLAAVRPPEQGRARVVALIALPGMFASQVCIFFDPEYFRTFANRTHPSQSWTALPPGRSLAREWDLALPPGFKEQGFREVIREPAEHDPGTFEVTYEGEIWMITDMKPELA